MDAIRELFFKSFETYDKDGVINYRVDETKDIRLNKEFRAEGVKYISKKVLVLMPRMIRRVSRKEYIFDKTNINLTMYITNKKYNTDLLINLLNYYVKTLNVINRMQTVNIIFYLMDVKKTVPKQEGYILNEDNVNTGVCEYNNGERRIIIYRIEDIEKVLLHELIHYYSIDFHFYNAGHDENFMTKYKIEVSKPYKNKVNPLCLYESFTEIVSCYGHILTYCLFNNMLKEEQINRVLKNERQHYMMQAAKVYKYGKLKENTHVFSYYICKAVVFNNLQRFLKLFKGIHDIPRSSQDKIDEYIGYLEGELDNKEVWKKIKRGRIKTLFLSSLRMTKIQW
jgi:hypothetical protein